MDHFAILLILGMSLLGLCNGEDHKPNNVSDLKVFGAFGDGVNDDSQVYLKKWNEMCASSNDSASLEIPDGTYLFNKVSFSGPCKPRTINFQINGNIVAPQSTDWCDGSTPWISFTKVNGLTISGNGKIDGQGSVWWSKFENADSRPIAMKISDCDNLKLDGLTHVNSQRNHITILNCNVVTISNLHINAPEDSPNTDGIDISSSTNIEIRDCVIGTGDDCVAIADKCSNINITNITCGPGHGISIGSLGKDGESAKVENIYVMNSSFIGTENGARIKTWQGGSGYAKNIHFSGINLTNTDNPIIIDQYYCNGAHDCGTETSAVQVSDVSFTGVNGTSAKQTAINLNCSKTVGCTNVVIDNVNIKSVDPSEKVVATCVNAHGKYEDVVPPLNKCLLS